MSMPSTQQPLTSATANPNAATAAAAVFKRHESNSSLSAAAAAAALRARPSTPTRVADVQTKRTLRRSASVASASSAPDNQIHGRPSLQRRGSSSSMSERTFRSPSPHRPSSGSGHRKSNSLTFLSTSDMPPVPELPREVRGADGQGKAADLISQEEPGHRRTTSLGISTTPLKVASQSLGTRDAPSWFGAAKMGDSSSVRRTDPAMASPPSSPPQVVHVIQEELEPERPSSRTSSVNFSYPTRARLGSPPVSPVDTRNQVEISPPEESRHQAQGVDGHQLVQQQRPKQRSESGTSSTRARPSSSSDQTLVYDPNSRRMVRRADLLAAEQTVLRAAEQPTKRKKKQTPQRAGSHLSKGTMGRTQRNASTTARIMKEEAAPAAPLQKIQSAPAHGPQEEPGEPDEPAVKAIIASPRIEAKRLEQQRQAGPSSLSAPEKLDTLFPPISTSIANETLRPTVRRQPSTVKEEPELESRSRESSAQRDVYHALDTVPSKQRLHPSHGKDGRPNFEESQNASTSPTSVGLSPSDIETPQSIDTRVSGDAPRRDVSNVKKASDALRERTHSSSPARQAHFGPVQENLTVRHSPPPRSISPRKSALKHSTSPAREPSPIEDASEADADRQGEEHQSTVSRKKSVRVSFDDNNTVVVGESAPTAETDSPVLASPQNTNTSRPWYSSIGRNKKRESGTSLDDDDDIVMKPRPALPSFGSIRDRKPREHTPEDGSERPLVRPLAETKYSPHVLASPPSLQSDSKPAGQDNTRHAMGQSSDHAIGAILSVSQDDAKRNADTSRFRDPLPPVVTTVEGSGYASDSVSSSDLDESIASQSLLEEHDAEQETHVAQTGTREDAQDRPRENKTDPESESKSEASNEKATKSHEVEIPTISVSQPSPAQPEKRDERVYFLDIPGGFPDDESDQSAGSRRSTDVAPASTSNLKSGAASSITGQKLDNITASQTPGTAHATSGEAVDLPSTESDTSIYSDAYEDLSEAEGDGFQSLNAMLEAPVVDRGGIRNRQATKPTHQEIADPEKTPTRNSPPKLESEFSVATTVVGGGTQSPGSPGSPGETALDVAQDEWERAKAYWRSLTAEKRAQLEREAREDAGIDADLDEGTGRPATPAKKPKKKSVERRHEERKVLVAHMAQQMMMAEQEKRGQRQQKVAVESAERGGYMIKPGTKWEDDNISENTTILAPQQKLLMKTLRGTSVPQQQEAAPRLRKSMRSGTKSSDALRPSPAPISASTGSKAERRMPMPFTTTGLTAASGAPGATINASGSDHRRSAIVASPSATQLPASPIRRRNSTSSESSFKRARAGSGGGGFRMSMRQQQAPSPTPPDKPHKRFSLRALSPSGSSGGLPFGRHTESPPPASKGSVAGETHMRRTLRGSTSSAAQERVSSPTGHGMRMPTFGLHSHGHKKSSGSNKGGSGKFSSRFADSSDEDDVGGRKGRFRSRFDDSSDDEDVGTRISTGVGIKSLAAPAAGAAANASSGASTLPPQRSVRNKSSIASTALPEELEESEESLNRGSAEANDIKRATPEPANCTITSSRPEQQQPQTEIRTSSIAGAGGVKADGTTPRLTTSSTGLRRTRSGRGEIVTSQTLPSNLGTFTMVSSSHPERRDSTASRRSSILSVLKRRKKEPTASSTSKISRPEVSESAARRDTKLERSASQLRGIRNIDEQEEEEGGGPVPVPASPRSATSSKLQKRAGGLLFGKGGNKGAAPAPVPSPVNGTKGNNINKEEDGQESPPLPEEIEEDEDEDEFHDLPPSSPAMTNGAVNGGADDKETGAIFKNHNSHNNNQRPATSGGLGTKTTIGTTDSPAPARADEGRRFLSRRTMSTGLMNNNLAATRADTDSIVTAGTAGTPSGKKKKFGALRKMFGLDN